MRRNRLCFNISAVALAASLCVGVSACSKKTDTAPAVSISPELTELTKQVRRYSIEKRKLPQNVEELVTVGYIKSVPPAPTGKKYAIDTDRAQVILVDQ